MATDIIARGMASEAERAANKYVAGTNINFIPQEDGTVKITASGDVSSEDDVARELINNHKIDMNNPHNVTAEQLGLGNVDNTSDISKPISKATQNALDGKSNTNHTHTTYDSHIENVGIHVTAEDKATWNGKAEVSDISNPNLLINPDFAVNQRGDITYDGTISYLTYFVDRWMRLGGVSKVDNGVSICKGNSPYGIGILAQKIENGTVYSGKTATLSAKVDGEVVTLSGVVSETVVSKSGTVSMDFALGSDGAILLQIYTSDTTAHIIEWAKFEISDFATDYQSPNGETELLKCQHYYQIRSSGDIAAVDMRPSMRAITDIKQRSDGTYEYIAEL